MAKKANQKPASGAKPAAENTVGQIVPKTEPAKGGADPSPPVKPETPKEEGLLQKAGELLEKGEIKVLNDAKDSVAGGIDSLVNMAGGGAAAQVVGAIGKGAVEVLFPTNVIDLIPGGKILSGGKKAAKIAEKLGKEAAEKAAKEAAEKAAKEAAEKAAKEAAEKAAKEAAEKKSKESKTKKAETKDGGNAKGGPCDHLKQGSGEGPYRGGAHSKTSKPANDGKDSHHMPADAATDLKKSKGPAIQMDPTDHEETSSNGQNKGSAKYIFHIAKLINDGKWREAMATEIKDVRRVAKEAGDPKKYNEAIREMLEYFKCLAKNNLLP